MAVNDHLVGVAERGIGLRQTRRQTGGFDTPRSVTLSWYNVPFSGSGLEARRGTSGEHLRHVRRVRVAGVLDPASASAA